MVARQANSKTPDTLRVTARQLELLRVIRRWALEFDRMPSVRELGDILERSPSTIHQHLAALERRGYLERRGHAHGLKLLVDDQSLGLDQAGAAVLLPVKGSIQPGRALRRSRPPYKRIAVGGEVRPEDYVLRVEGGRLEAEGIFDGDMLLVRPGTLGDQPAVLLFLDGTADVKRLLTLRDGSLAMLPVGPRVDRRRARRCPEGVVVQGRVVRLIRSYR